MKETDFNGEVPASSAVAYAYSLVLKPGIEASHGIVQQMPDVLEPGMVRDSLRTDTQSYLAVRAGIIQTSLEQLQEEPLPEYQEEVATLMQKVQSGELDQHHIELLRAHPHYERNRELVERFITSMIWSSPEEREVESSRQALGRREDFNPDKVVSLRYDQHNTTSPVSIILRDKPYRRRK